MYGPSTTVGSAQELFPKQLLMPEFLFSFFFSLSIWLWLRWKLAAFYQGLVVFNRYRRWWQWNVGRVLTAPPNIHINILLPVKENISSRPKITLKPSRLVVEPLNFRRINWSPGWLTTNLRVICTRREQFRAFLLLLFCELECVFLSCNMGPKDRFKTSLCAIEFGPKFV